MCGNEGENNLETGFFIMIQKQAIINDNMRQKQTVVQEAVSYTHLDVYKRQADIYSYLQENQGELEKLKERLTELREISEKKYMFVEKKYRKYDKANELFREEDS